MKSERIAQGGAHAGRTANVRRWAAMGCASVLVLALAACLNQQDGPLVPVPEAQPSAQGDAPGGPGEQDAAAPMHQDGSATMDADAPMPDGLSTAAQEAWRSAMEAAREVTAADPRADAATVIMDTAAPPTGHAVWADAQPPLTAEFLMDYSLGPQMPIRYLRLRSRADRLEVHGITLNRGNCVMAESGKVATGIHLPFALKFGGARRFRVQGCDQVIEAVVDTQYGPYTFTW